MINAEDVKAKIDSGGEFNVDLELEITQQLSRRGKQRELRVGRCSITFHCTPKELAAQLRNRRRERQEQRSTPA